MTDAWNALKWLALAVVTLFVLAFVAEGLGLVTYRTWAPRREAARRQVWEQTPSYVQGKALFLSRLKGEWMASDSAHRDALCFTARQEASTIDHQLLPESIRGWECVK